MDAGSKDIPSPQPSDIETRSTRRGFLKRVGLGLGALAVASALPKDVPATQTQPEIREQLKPLSLNVVIIDFATSSPTEGIRQHQFITEQEFLKSILQQDYVDEKALESRYGPNFRENIPKMMGVDPKTALLYGFLQNDNYTQHGVNVASTMQETLRKTGFTTTIDMSPLQNLIDERRVKCYTDKIGNKHLSFSVSPEKVIAALQKYPDQKIVNMSFEFGDIDVSLVEFETVLPHVAIKDPQGGASPMYIFDIDWSQSDPEKGIYRNEKNEEITPKRWADRPREKEHIEPLFPPKFNIEGGYTKEKIETSLEQLFKVCQAFPDKLFISAAGNYGENLRQAMKTMPNIPTNLLLTAEWGNSTYTKDYQAGSVFGAQIYVPNEKFGIKNGSSFSTPFISSWALILLDKGLSTDEVRKRIAQACELKEYKDSDDTVNQANVFDPSKLQI